MTVTVILLILALLYFVWFISKPVSYKNHTTEKLITIYKMLSYGQKHFKEVEEELLRRKVIWVPRDYESIQKNKDTTAFDHGQNSTSGLMDLGSQYVDIFKQANSYKGAFHAKLDTNPSVYITATLPLFIAAYYVAFHRGASASDKEHAEFIDGVKKQLTINGFDSESQNEIIGKFQKLIPLGLMDLLNDPQHEENNYPDGSLISQVVIKFACENYNIEHEQSNEISLATRMLDDQVKQWFLNLDKLYNPSHLFISSMY